MYVTTTQGFERRSQMDHRGLEIERTFDLLDGCARNAMCIDHRGPDVAVAQKLLDRADAVIDLSFHFLNRMNAIRYVTLFCRSLPG